MNLETNISQPGTSAAAHTSVTSGNWYVWQASVANVGGASDTLTVYLVKSDDTAADDTAVIFEQTINNASAPEVLNALLNIKLGPGDAIHAKAGASATALTLTITVAQF